MEIIQAADLFCGAGEVGGSVVCELAAGVQKGEGGVMRIADFQFSIAK